MKVEIVFENSDIICVDKPCGLPIHPTVDKSRVNLLSEIEKMYPDENIILHHRLDVGTSGLVLFSKTDNGKNVLSEAFQNQKVEKKYLALVKGNLRDPSGRFEDFVKETKSGRQRKMECVRSGGKKAILEYKVLISLRGFSLVEVKLITGRKHQIRVQFSTRGHPLLGDNLYGDEKFHCENSISRIFLHAKELNFGYEEEVSIVSETPSEFLKMIESKWIPDEKIYLKFHKPYGVVTQFSGEDSNLSEFNFPIGVYPIGRLDKDSEGLLILSNDKSIVSRLLSPEAQKEKVYFVLVEGSPDEKELDSLRNGIQLKEFKALPCEVEVVQRPGWIGEGHNRVQKEDESNKSWLKIILREGKNRQVRKMTAAVGYPTLRLVRQRFSNVELENLPPGMWEEINLNDLRA